MRISDFRKNGCFRGYNLSRWTQTSPAGYEHLKPLLTTRFDSDPVFYLQQSHLPSHMRSLRLSRHTDQRAVRHAPSKLRQTLVTVAVIIAFVLSVACFSISLYYWRVKEDSTPSVRQDGHESTGIPSAQSTGEKNKTIQKIKDITKLVKHKKGIVEYLDSRLRCSAVTCPAYSAFRFRSSCIHGVCQCKGENYQRTTCLPKYGDCHIEEKETTNGSVRVYNKGEQPPVFACRSSTDVTRHVHVISSFGNGGRNETTVEILGNSKSPTPVTVVLSNYQKIHWRVVVQGAVIRQIFLVSYHQLRRSTVRVETGSGASPPPVQKLFSRVGYGEDRHGGHTVTLLRTVNSRVGPVSSFTGTDMADRWTVDLNTL